MTTTCLLPQKSLLRDQGQLEVYVHGKRVDILSAHYAVEVDWLRKWEEGIEQALEYAKLTGKRPGLAIILEDEDKNSEKFNECQRVCEEKRIKLWVVNEYVSEKEVRFDFIEN